MKRPIALALVLFLLCACGDSSQPYSTDLVDKVLESDVFTEPLEPLDREIAGFIYQLGPELDKLTDLKAYRSAGANCEEVAVFIFQTEADASAGRSALEQYLATRLGDCRDYMPEQAAKLENATLAQHTNTLLLLVPGDWMAAEEFTP